MYITSLIIGRTGREFEWNAQTKYLHKRKYILRRIILFYIGTFDAFLGIKDKRILKTEVSRKNSLNICTYHFLHSVGLLCCVFFTFPTVFFYNLKGISDQFVVEFHTKIINSKNQTFYSQSTYNKTWIQGVVIEKIRCGLCIATLYFIFIL